MARYDKYDPYDGGFRAELAEAIVAADKNVIYGVGLDSSGRVVLGAGQTGVVGVLIAHSAKVAGDIVDVMTDGEIVEFTATSGTAGAAGTSYFASTTTGAISTTNTGTRVGFTAEGTRLIVRAAR